MTASALAERVRGGAAAKYLITAAYHTPNGPLHLGHVGGPFLRADAVARWLRCIGHQVHTVSSTDGHESYVLLAALAEDCEPEEIVHRYHEAARGALQAFDMAPELYFDQQARPWKTMYDEHSHAFECALAAEGRIIVRGKTHLRSPGTARFLVGAFAVGRCPACGAGVGGSSCEQCGVWFGPAALVDPTGRLPEDANAVPIQVDTVWARASDAFCLEEAERRFAAPYATLLGRYIDLNGPEILLTHPIGWGVPWQERDLGEGIVHSSYGLGLPAATRIMGSLYAGLSGHGVDAFGTSSGVITVATGGFDATLPWMFLLGLTCDAIDWEPYRFHVLNRFLRLNGQKFSTSRNHVIWAHDYAAAGLSTDALRVYLGLLSPSQEEANFRTQDFAQYTRDVLVHGWEASVAAALRDAAAPPHCPPDDGALRSAESVLMPMAEAFSLPDVDTGRAVSILAEWFDVAGQSLRASSPALFVRVAAVLAEPFMPRWSEGLWRACGDGRPSVEGLLDPVRIRSGPRDELRVVTDEALESLLPQRTRRP